MRVRLKHRALATRLARSQRSQNHWALRLGLSRGHLSDLVNGKRSYPSARVRGKLLDGMEASFDELFEVEQKPGPEDPDEDRLARRLLDLRIGNHRLVLAEVRQNQRKEGIWKRMRDLLENLKSDLSLGLRKLWRSPGYAASITLTLAIGIASLAIVSAFIETFLIRPVPGIPSLEGVVNIRSISADGDGTALFLSYPNYQDLKNGASSLSQAAAFSGLRLVLGRPGENPRLVSGQLNTSNYFSILGLKPIRGRFFTAEEDSAGGAQALAVISENFWRTQLGGEESALGSKIHLNGQSFTIIGVAPPGFRGHFLGFPFDLFLPTSMAPIASRDLQDRSDQWVETLARLHPGATLAQARADVELITGQLAERYPEVNRRLTLRVSETTGVEEDFRQGLFLFLGTFLVIAILILASASLNVANLMTARLIGRTQELAVRQALGARPARIAFHLIWESLLFATPGGLLGLLVSWFAVAQLNRLLTSATSLEFSASVGPLVIWLSAVLTALIAVFLGMVTALRMGRRQLLSAIQAGGQRGGSATRLNGGLISAQIAICLVLLVMAGLFLRALERSKSLNPGFDPKNVTLAAISPQQLGLDEDRSRLLYENVLRETRQLPGIDAASLSSRVPLSFGARFFSNTLLLGVPGHQPPEGEDGFWIESASVSDQFFESLQIPIVSGRDFSLNDRPDSRAVGIVNESFADRFWPGQEAVGRTLTMKQKRIEVIGVAATSKYRSIAEPDQDFLYLPWAQNFSSATLIVRSTQGHGERSDRLHEIISRAEPGLPVPPVSTLDEQLEAAVLPQQLGSILAALMGLVALTLAAVGLYGVVSFAVGRRRREIGIRMSLGARPGEVIRLIQRQGLRPTLLGLAIGLVLAMLGTRFLAGFLQGVSPLDPLVFGGTLAILMVGSGIASYIPASRAARIDPNQTLKAE